MDNLKNSFRFPQHTLRKVTEVDEYAGILGKIFPNPPHSTRQKIVDIFRRKLPVVDSTVDQVNFNNSMFDAILFHFLETNGNSYCIGTSIFVNSFNELREGKKFTEVFSLFFKLTTERVAQTGHVVKRCDYYILEAYLLHLQINNNETKNCGVRAFPFLFCKVWDGEN